MVKTKGRVILVYCLFAYIMFSGCGSPPTEEIVTEVAGQIIANWWNQSDGRVTVFLTKTQLGHQDVLVKEIDIQNKYERKIDVADYGKELHHFYELKVTYGLKEILVGIDKRQERTAVVKMTLTKRGSVWYQVAGQATGNKKEGIEEFFSKQPPLPRPRVLSLIDSLKSRGQGVVKEEPKIDYSKAFVVLETEKGTIEIDLLYDIAPKTVENFAKKVTGRRYNQAKFYHVEPELLIQAGAPVFQTEELPIENNNRDYVRGTVAMAKGTGASVSSATDFYICLTELVLEEKSSIFGMVVKGMDVADKIVKGDKITLATIRTEN